MTEIDDRIRHLLTYSGWTWVLPAQPAAHLGCLESGGGETMLALSQRCERVTAVATDPRRLDELRRVAELARARIDVVLARDARGSFDGVVLHSLSTDAGASAARAALMAGLTETGFLFQLAPNRLAYTAVGCLRLGRGSWGSLSLRRRANRAGRRHQRVFPLMIYGSQVHELLGDDGYACLTGSEVGSEQIKRRLLGPRTQHVFAPAFAVSATVAAVPSRFDRLVEAITAELGYSAESLAVERTLIAPEKLVLLMRHTDGERFATLVIPDLAAWEIRAQEATLVGELATAVPSLSGLLPKHRVAGRHGGHGFIVMERIAGTAIDADVADLPALTGSVVDVLLRLHYDTRREVIINEAVFADLFGSLFAEAEARHPWASRFLEHLELEVRELVIGTRVPTVWSHGDFKIENVLIDAATRRPVGVIDWETSRPADLPLLDLFYLLTYNRWLTESARFHAVFLDIVLRGEWTDSEAAHLQRYGQDFPMSPALVAALEAMFLVHALARRLRFQPDHAGDEALLFDLLTSAAAHVGAALTSMDRATGTEG